MRIQVKYNTIFFKRETGEIFCCGTGELDYTMFGEKSEEIKKTIGLFRTKHDIRFLQEKGTENYKVNTIKGVLINNFNEEVINGFIIS